MQGKAVYLYITIQTSDTRQLKVLLKGYKITLEDIIKDINKNICC